jgi:hypothetical protein
VIKELYNWPEPKKKKGFNNSRRTKRNNLAPNKPENERTNV